MSPRAFAVVAALACARAASPVDLISDEQYYSMPELFHLDDYDGCLATRGVYCVGSFELSPDTPHHQLFNMMQRVSANWIDHYNHTRVHRGFCVSRRCKHLSRSEHETAIAIGYGEQKITADTALITWFNTCVNESLSTYNLSSKLYRFDYCRRGPDLGLEHQLDANERGFAILVAMLLALCALSTIIEIALPMYHKKVGAQWAVSWSLPGCWRSLKALPASSAETDLRCFDGMRVVCMMCIIIEHVVWLTTISYVQQPRYSERSRRDPDVMLLTNSTLVVQIFFLMSSFLLAHKLLTQRRRNQPTPLFSTFFSTMVNRIIRLSPSYIVVVWFAASWWPRLGRGPLWTALVESEASVCRRLWWKNLLFINNFVHTNEKCLPQTWYLAADMQLYVVSLVLTLLLWRLRRGAIYVLLVLLGASTGLLFGLAYAWHIVPTFIMHRFENIRNLYSGDASFNIVYQSPLGNLCGALAGLLLAHLHHHLLDTGIKLNQSKWFRWSSVAAAPAGLAWMAASPLLLGAGEPSRLYAALFAVLERPVFLFLMGLAILGALQNVDTPWRRWVSWSGMATPARLSFGTLLLHMPINQILVASRLTPNILNRSQGIVESLGIACVSYWAAIPLALLVEMPVQRLHRALTDPPLKATK